MRKAIFFALLLSSFVASVAQVPASRRYEEKSPLQYKIGPWPQLAPYNNTVGYTATSVNSVSPSSATRSTNGCTSTADFTTVLNDGPGSLSASAGACTMTTAAATGKTFIIGSTATLSTFSAPNVFLTLNVTANGSAAFTDILGLGLYNSGHTLEIQTQLNHATNGATITVYSGGTYTDLTSSSFTMPSVPWKIGFSLIGSYASAWYNTGSGWVYILGADISSKYDPRTSGLPSCMAGVKTYTDGATTWNFSSLVTGLTGGNGLRDQRFVTYPDGRPYSQGSVYYLTGTVAGITNNPPASGNGIFTLDMSTQTLNMIGTFGMTRGSGVYEDQALHVVYDPSNNIERMVASNWGSATTIATALIFYGQQSISTDDWLTAGYHVVPTMSQVTTPAYSTMMYDPGLMCTSWNYSASACSLWKLDFTRNGHPEIASSASDPSLNSWTTVLDDSSVSSFEGSNWLRTATTRGSSGVAYTACWSDSFTVAEIRSTRCYADDGTYLSPLGVMLPSASVPGNPSHIAMLSYGNNLYTVGFDSTMLNATAQTMGNMVLAQNAKYAAQTNYPQLVNEGSIFGGSSSLSSQTLTTGAITGTFTESVGDLIIAVIRGANPSVGSVAFSNSLGDSFTCGSVHSLSSTGTGFDYGCYGFATHSGAVTFSVSLGASSQYLGMTVMQFSPGFLTSADGAITYSDQTGSSNLYTTSTFSTTSEGLIVACADALFGAGTFQPGTIGPYSSTASAALSSGATFCEATVTDAAQTNITAKAASSTGSASWIGTIFTFK